MSAVWKVLFADQAELDLLEITIWTVEKFGDRQADEYAETISLAIEALHDGPESTRRHHTKLRYCDCFMTAWI